MKDIPLTLLAQYRTMHTSLMTQFGVDMPTPRRDWQLLNSTLLFLDDLGLTELKRPRKLSPSASRKIRNKNKLKPQHRVYEWVADGDASDYLCSRYVGTIWSSAYAMPVPGDATSMNDSHINCQCRMEFIGMADSKGNLIDSRQQYDDDPYAGPQGVAS